MSVEVPIGDPWGEGQGDVKLLGRRPPEGVRGAPRLEELLEVLDCFRWWDDGGKHPLPRDLAATVV